MSQIGIGQHCLQWLPETRGHPGSSPLPAPIPNALGNPVDSTSKTHPASHHFSTLPPPHPAHTTTSLRLSYRKAFSPVSLFLTLSFPILLSTRPPQRPCQIMRKTAATKRSCVLVPTPCPATGTWPACSLLQDMAAAEPFLAWASEPWEPPAALSWSAALRLPGGKAFSTAEGASPQRRTRESPPTDRHEGGQRGCSSPPHLPGPGSHVSEHRWNPPTH